MNVFIVSFVLFFKAVYALEESELKFEKGRVENFYELHSPSAIANQTDSSFSRNEHLLTLESNYTKETNNSKNRTRKYIYHSDFANDLSKIISSKLADITRKKLESLLSTEHSLGDRNAVNKLESPKTNTKQRELIDFGKVESRQFLFHPYLPYGKDSLPDEKISIHDVLPVKMVKFIKSMVEDAPWEAMFMKMVRMVVDQFVDKIIEKMFANKDDDGKGRSMDDQKPPSWSFLKDSFTSLVRTRRSSTERKSGKEADWDSSSFSQTNRLSKTDEHKVKESDEDNWLDSILDFLFPEETKDGEFDSEERKKRGIDQPHPIKQLRMEDILHTFLMKYLDLSEAKTPPSEIATNSTAAQNVTNRTHTNHSPENNLKTMPAHLPKRWSKLLHVQQLAVLNRPKRSIGSEKLKDDKRLWQENHPSKTRDECSLRRACNAGRLLSRLPSVQDLTLQLKEYGNEPHWDALLWGMTKKKCSKIFCKRHRSPKGEKYLWRADAEKIFRKHSTRSPRDHKFDLPM